jgi:hypothetical protein
VSQFSTPKTDIQISPNPASDFINVKLTAEDNAATIEITIHTAMAQFLKKIIQNPIKSSRSEITIPDSNWRSGEWCLLFTG